MPAYFSLTFEFKKSQDAIRAFCETLVDSGLVFKGGYQGFESDSFDDIITWNQNKLDENFQLGSTGHHSHDYKQLLFDYLDFSEVRVFILNSHKKPTFTFELIVPEDDLLDYTEENGIYCVHRKAEKMDQLRSFAKKVWAHSAALAIQTGWEGSDLPPSAKKISEGIAPQIEPFCIINSLSLEKEIDLVFENIERSGVLIEDITQWNY